VDADVEKLVREQRLLEAAVLASARGDAAGASALFEQACEWRSAATQALRAGDALRALDLALRADDTAIAERAAARVGADPAAADRAAFQLTQRGRHDWAARLFESSGRELDAARAWERAGDALRSAPLYERAGQPAEAARVLEATLRRDPEAAGAAAAFVALGALLLRFGKEAAAVRALQRVLPGAPERRAALEHLVGALRHLGLNDAASDAAAELSRLGGEASPAPAPTAPTALAASRLYGRYEGLRPIASSASARLLEGFDRGRGERVAIKVYAPGAHAVSSTRAALARLEHDVLVIRALEDPAIVPILEFHPSGPAVVLAWMAGGSLEAWLARGAVPPDRAVEIAGSVLGALGAAHRAGVLHRDVKPANVLFDAAGAARLSDFGAAHAADASATVTAGDLGALAYLSPEQREGRAATVQSDLYAVGILLREMLGDHARGARLDARHLGVLARLTAPDPRDRPADAFQARELLSSVSWPGAMATASAPARGVTVTTEIPEQPRLEPRSDGTLLDGWTGRPLERVPLSDAVLERARRFAQAEHVALQTVLRIDREDGCLWLAACGPPPARSLTPGERERVDGAIDALLGAGLPPDEVDPTRVAVDAAGDVVLRFA
jgi:tetratricopeptide (TPR) repeat protein